MASCTTVDSARSGPANVLAATMPPGWQTRPASRSAASGSPANWKAFTPVMAPKKSLGKGSSCRSPSHSSAVGTRAAATVSRPGLTSRPVTVAPRARASSSSRPLPQPASSSRVPAVTEVASSTASNSGRVCGSANRAQSSGLLPQSCCCWRAAAVSGPSRQGVMTPPAGSRSGSARTRCPGRRPLDRAPPVLRGGIRRADDFTSYKYRAASWSASRTGAAPGRRGCTPPWRRAPPATAANTPGRRAFPASWATGDGRPGRWPTAGGWPPAAGRRRLAGRAAPFPVRATPPACDGAAAWCPSRCVNCWLVCLSVMSACTLTVFRSTEGLSRARPI